MLVDVIQYLDSTKQSNTKIREAVDEILNHSNKLHENSNIELDEVELLVDFIILLLGAFDVLG